MIRCLARRAIPGKGTSILLKPLLNSKTNQRQWYAVFGVLSLAVAGLTGILLLSRDSITNRYQGSMPGNPAGFFRQFIGSIHPLLAIGLVAVAGLGSLGLLRSRGWFAMYSRRSLPGITVAAIPAILFGTEIIFAEITGIIRLPADLNVAPPWSLLFYPVIAYIAEVVSHTLPLARLLTTVCAVFKKLTWISLVWLCILVVSFLEPIFQVGSEQPFAWSNAYIEVHVLAINLVQLAKPRIPGLRPWIMTGACTLAE